MWQGKKIIYFQECKEYGPFLVGEYFALIWIIFNLNIYILKCIKVLAFISVVNFIWYLLCMKTLSETDGSYYSLNLSIEYLVYIVSQLFVLIALYRLVIICEDCTSSLKLIIEIPLPFAWSPIAQRPTRNYSLNRCKRRNQGRWAGMKSDEMPELTGSLSTDSN